MEMPDRFAIERNARQLRAEELNRMVHEGALRWTALKDRLRLALARNFHPGSPVTPKG